jgi:hypothetical protein
MEQEQDNNNSQAQNNNNLPLTDNQNHNFVNNEHISILDGHIIENYIVQPEFQQRGSIHYNILPLNTINIIQ